MRVFVKIVHEFVAHSTSMRRFTGLFISHNIEEWSVIYIPLFKVDIPFSFRLIDVGSRIVDPSFGVYYATYFGSRGSSSG
jgi:hypothetical protein